jgi:NAD(P)H-dependent flavin oxidoreductase YrpB (nitropropane dioxygenase family)
MDSRPRLLGIDVPIVQAGMGGGITSPELIATVSETGQANRLVRPEPAGAIVARLAREGEAALRS